MTTRQRHTPQVKALALQIAAAEGANVAADRTGVKAATIRVWMKRTKDAGEAPDSPEADAADLEAKPAEAMGVDEWVELQRLTEQRYRRALASGSPSDSRWYAISLGVISDKLKAARSAPMPDGTEAQGAVSLPDAEVAQIARERISKIVCLIIGTQAGKALRELGEADDTQLDAEIRRRHDFIRRLEREVRWIWEERTRRRLGEPSLFGPMMDPPDGGADVLRDVKPPRTGNFFSATEPEDPVMPCVPLEGGDLDRARSYGSKLERVEAFESAGKRFDAKMAKAHARRRRSGWAGPRRGYDARFDHQRKDNN